MGSISVGPQLDDTELEDELEELQQQQIEDKMLETGPVPVDRLPAVANGESKFRLHSPIIQPTRANTTSVKGKAPAVAEDDEEAELKRLQAEMAM